MAKSKPKKQKQILECKNATPKIAKYVQEEREKPVVFVLEKNKPIPFKKENQNDTNLSYYERIKAFLYDNRSKKQYYDSVVEHLLNTFNKFQKIERTTIGKNFLDLLCFLKEKRATEIIENDDLLLGLFMMAKKMGSAVRPLNAWKRKSHNTHKQFRSLLEHLFIKYKVPECFYGIWEIGNLNQTAEKHIDWCIQLTNGASVRALANFPVKVTPKIAHYFVNSPDYVSVNEAIRYAQVMACGGDEYLAWYINQSYLGRNGFNQEEFWETVIAFFARTPMFDAENVPNLVDYLEAQHHQNRDFSMKGRTINALLRQSEEWHAELAQRRKANSLKKNIIWEKCNINTFVKEEGAFEHNNYKKFVLRELLSSNELQKEGSAMNHCVASYAYKCEKRTTAIFTLEQIAYWGELCEKMVTIEINLNTKEVVQIKGKYNRQPTQRESNIVQMWIDENNLRKSRWIS